MLHSSRSLVGGGPNEWRIAEDVEKRIVEELGLQEEAMI